jgi:glutamate dehydrogenase/leucine dehydrogenase
MMNAPNLHSPNAKSPFENAKNQMLDAARLGGFSENAVAKLLEVERVLEAGIVLKMDNGRTETFRAYRSQHSSAR